MLLDDPLHEGNVDLREHIGIIGGAVMLEFSELQVLRDRVELMSAELRQNGAGDQNRVDRDKRMRHIMPRKDLADK